MTTRLRWMGLGMIAGAGGTVWAERRLRRRVERYLPAQLRADVAARVRAAGSDLRGALEEGRAAMTQREAELRAQLRLAPPSLPAPGDAGDDRADSSEDREEDGGEDGGPARPPGRARLRVVGGRPGDPPPGTSR